MFIIEENLKKVGQKVRDYEQIYDRQVSSVELMAVSKKKPAQLIEQAYHSGHRIFGENYVQEAIEKQHALQHLDAIKWHFIGPIQSNKTQDIAQHFDWVHSVDRLKIAKRLSAQRALDRSAINICLQVNIDNEPTKSGFSKEELLPAAKEIMQLPQLKVRGLMAIPKPRETLDEQREGLRRVKQLYAELQALLPQVDTLSMGMSNDMQAAIAEGSTMIRIGTAIFGNRT